MKAMKMLRVSALCIVLIIICLFGNTTAQAALPLFEVLFQDTDGKWLGADGTEVNLDNLTKINETSERCYRHFEMWHWSSKDGYWEKDKLTIMDNSLKDNYNENFNKQLASYKLDFDLPMPDDVESAVDNNLPIYIAIKPQERFDAPDEFEFISNFIVEDTKKMFVFGSNQAELDAKPTKNRLNIKMPVQYNFMKGSTNGIITIPEASQQIALVSGNHNTVSQNEKVPIPDPKYGILLGAIWLRTGGDLLVGSQIHYADGKSLMTSSEKPWWLGNLKMDTDYETNNRQNAILNKIFDKTDVFTSPKNGITYTGNQITIGSKGSFGGGAAVGVRFYYPIEIDYYYRDPDIAVAIESIPSAVNPGTTVPCKFIVTSTFTDPDLTTDYRFTVDGEDLDNGELQLNYNDPTKYEFSFTMPDHDVTVEFAVNEYGDNPPEKYLDNNKAEAKVSCLAYVEPDVELDWDVLEQKFLLDMFATSATLGPLPSGSSDTQYRWKEGSTTGELNDPEEPPDIYYDFYVDNNPSVPQNTAEANALTIDRNPIIHTLLRREDLGDNPLLGDYGLELSSPTPPKTERIVAGGPNGGSIERVYQVRHRYYEESEDEGGSTSYWGDWNDAGTISAPFNEIVVGRTIAAKVYNGKEKINPDETLQMPTELIQDIISENDLLKKIWWKSKYKDEAQKLIEIDVVRTMRYLDEDGQPEDVVDVAGRYKRLFVAQDWAEVKWTPAGDVKFDGAYDADREAAKYRVYKSSPTTAVFASDMIYSSKEFPIRSGYFFNPTGTYKFTVTTEVYKHEDSDGNPQEEHRTLVESLVKAFRYDSNMVYIDAYDDSKTPITVNGTPAVGGISYPPQLSDTIVCVPEDDYNMDDDYETTEDVSPLFSITVEANYQLDEVEELKSPFTSGAFTSSNFYPYVPYDDATLNRTDARFRRTLEGYEESGTEGSRTEYNYVEFVHEDEVVYKIRETTTVTITVNPLNTKVYTHLKMKNGVYSIRTYFDDIGADIINQITYGNLNKPLSGVVPLHEITIDVIGSMYDDPF